MSEKKIEFVHNESQEDLKKIYHFNAQAFTDSHDFSWTIDNLQLEIEKGWHIYSVEVEQDIICVLFMKIANAELLTKNTPIKMEHRGQGFSHIIKEFYEEYAKIQNIGRLINFCPIDNFRMISLNERHGYEKTGNIMSNNENMIEWVKEIL